MSTLPVGTVVFENVSKRYRLGALGTLRSTLAELTNRGRAEDSARDLWALKDISFRVEPGDSLGLIGPNGAGKTTALKLLSNITQPTSGHIQVSGRFASLIELGAGFHPELSGRDNIFLNGAILGLKRHEIRQKLDEIIAFSELERFIDTPVKRYSSGMYVRLGFAVAVHVAPDVLLVDEVLAVGDASYRQKCLERMESLQHSGTTILFVSHNMAQVRRLCRQSILLIQGKASYYGKTEDALRAYQQSIYALEPGGSNRYQESSSNSLLVQRVSLATDAQEEPDEIRFDDALTVKLHLSGVIRIMHPIVKLWLIRKDSTVCGFSIYKSNGSGDWVPEGQSEITARINPVQLTSGVYSVEIRVIDEADSVLLASGQSPWFRVIGPTDIHQAAPGVYVPQVTWKP